MAIKEQTPLTFPEVIELAGDGEKATEIKSFIKKFTKMKPEKAREMKEDLTKLDLIKLKADHIVNIVNFVPQDSEDLIKILPGVSLDQDDINKILEVVKKY